MVADNFALVKHMSKLRFWGPQNEAIREDLESEGVLGLMDATRYYKPAIGPFSTYACTAIYRRMMRCREKLVRHKAISLNVEGATEGTLLHTLACNKPQPWEAMQGVDLRRSVMMAIQSLDERSREILCRRSEGETLDEIGATYDLSKERVRQIQDKALRQLKTVLAESA